MGASSACSSYPGFWNEARPVSGPAGFSCGRIYQMYLAGELNSDIVRASLNSLEVQLDHIMALDVSIGVETPASRAMIRSEPSSARPSTIN